MQVALVILAAGQGSRMNSDLPKVLHKVAAAPLLHHAMTAGRSLDPALTVVVTGHGAELVEKSARAFDPDVPIKPLHTMSVAQVQKEAEDLGLKYEKAESLSWQNMITFINP